MSVLFALHRSTPDVSPTRDLSRRIAAVRALFALAWAAALIVAVGHRVPSTHSDIPFAAAALLTTYPAIDAIASILGTSSAAPASVRLLRINAAISTIAVAALAVTAFGYHAASALVAFGAWAAVSGGIQFAIAVRRRRAQGRQLPMLLSGGLSIVAGVGFIATSSGHAAHLTNVAGYMALGAVLYLLWAHHGRTAS